MTKKENELLNKMIAYFKNNNSQIDFNYQKKEIDNILRNHSNNSKVILLKDLIEDCVYRRINECSLFGTILMLDEYTKIERYLLAHYYIPFKNGDYEFERDCFLSVYSKKEYYSLSDLIHNFALNNGTIVDKDRINDFLRDHKMDSLNGFKKYKNPYKIHIWKEDNAEIKQDYKNLANMPDEERNSIIGDFGETIVYEYERQRLHKMGRDDLADRVLHVSRYLGDIYGYDILSFDGTKDKEGNDCIFLIEVKGYYSSTRDNIYLSNNEYQQFSSNEEQDNHTQYLVYQIDYHRKKLYPIIPYQGDGLDVSGNIYKLSQNKKKKVLRKI